MANKAAKKRNPQDSTRRNVQAANKRLLQAERDIRFLNMDLGALRVQLGLILQQLARLNAPPDDQVMVFDAKGRKVVKKR